MLICQMIKGSKELTNFEKLLLAAFNHLTYQHDSKYFKICNYKIMVCAFFLIKKLFHKSFWKISYKSIVFLTLKCMNSFFRRFSGHTPIGSFRLPTHGRFFQRFLLNLK